MDVLTWHGSDSSTGSVLPVPELANASSSKQGGGGVAVAISEQYPWHNLSHTFIK